MEIKNTINKLISRGRINRLAQEIGVRPIGGFNAAMSELNAAIARFDGESPEHVEDLLSKAQKERNMDVSAERLLLQRETSDSN